MNSEALDLRTCKISHKSILVLCGFHGPGYDLADLGLRVWA